MIGSLFSVIKNKSRLILGGIAVILFALLMYNVYNYGQLEQENENLNMQYAELVSKQIQLKNQAESQQESLAELRSNNEEILSNYNRAIENLDKLRGMEPEQVREQKPVIRKQLNDEYENLQNRFSCITGDVSKCSNK